MIFHLYSKHFTSSYVVWIAHEKSYSSNFVHGGSSRSTDEVVNLYRMMVVNACYPKFDCRAGESRVEDESPKTSATKFFPLLNDVDEPLWPSCVNHTKLAIVSQLLNVKFEFNISEACYDRLISIVKGMLPKDVKLLENFYKAKQMVTRLGLSYVKVHVILC